MLLHNAHQVPPENVGGRLQWPYSRPLRPVAAATLNAMYYVVVLHMVYHLRRLQSSSQSLAPTIQSKMCLSP